MFRNCCLLFLLLAPTFLLGQIPCKNGTVNGFPCNQVDYYADLGTVALSGGLNVNVNDLWGWTDPQTGKEYALVGLTNGTVFVDISSPSSPIIVGRLASHTGNSSAWRDIKVYNNHAYVVADGNPGHGMQVFDLSRLRNYVDTPIDFSNDGHYGGVGSAHNVVINEATGYAYIVGAKGAANNCGQGGLHIVDIKDPKNPVFAGCFDSDGYTHDAQCVIYEGPDSAYKGKEICFNANENTITIANVDSKSNTQLISKQGYPQSGYSHQGWLTEDHRFFISNDELDERNSGINTRTLIWDVTDLDAPKLITEYFSERKGIDHNLYVKDNKIYQSNYTNGLIILDATKTATGNIRELAFFDTYPQSDNTSFNGAWSNYPFFNSGTVIVSDINNGLFVLKPNILEIILAHPVFVDCATEQTISVEVSGEFTVASYQWQKIENNQPIDLSDDAIFSGTNNAAMTVNSSAGNIEDLKFRCKVTLTSGEIAYSYLSNSASGRPLAQFNFDVAEKEVQFFNQSENYDSLQWDFGDGSEIVTEANPIHRYQEVGMYTVTLTAFNECGETASSQTLDLVILSNKLPSENGIEAFPNPAGDLLQIEGFKNEDPESLLIIDKAGKTVLAQTDLRQEKLSLNVSNWTPGMYFLIITKSNGQRELKKIIKK